MKDDQKTDELLNGFIDGELSPREQTEVKRLIAHDPEAAKRLKELQRCKLLVESLPASKAPSEILIRLRRAKFGAEESAKGGQTVRPRQQILGTIQLFLRKSIAAAAMFILLFGLAVMVYQIVSPAKQEPKVARTILPQPVLDNPTPVTVAEAEKELPAANVKAAPEAPANVFTARLELKTKKAAAAQAKLQKLLEKNLPSDFVALPSEADRFIFTLNCSGDKMSALLADFENIWNEFESASLFVETAGFDRIIVIDKITPMQLADITSQQNLDRQLKAASYFSIVNNIQQSRFAADTPSSKPNDIPQPVLAKDEQAKTSPGQAGVIHLTIEIVSE
jgi:hypothetical protein